ncbi:hypothetical protein [Sedimenticola selenatireducens]|uniref:Uncharacterized protein n=1 Tax=Sedimenticola selenatireducens TaxID=191960 RepID=A0A558E1X7_9GAMM|nr:hypothetical protein [Sedimenticola selenatireducens]TVO75103.1 hypothetical protein FHP88_08810 [Sedimenticola selenatireducens]TVT67043.1 MAG: hypothetical protein FHK78_01550 [Sedimenticola selenatireducens]
MKKRQYEHVLDRMIDLFKYGTRREKELENELAKTKAALYHIEQCYLDALTEIKELRDDLYREIGSTSS